MARAPSLSNAAATLAADAVTPELDGGYFRLYTGPKPANVDVAITTQTLLAELRFDAIAFGPALNGLAAANPITSDPAAPASGQATWLRAFKADGLTAIFDGTVGTVDCDLNLDNPNIVMGGVVNVAAYTYEQRRT